MRLNWEGPTGSGQLDIESEIIVGRAPGNGLVLDDGQVSRRHAAFRPAAGGVQVEDLGSYNGTYLNGERIGAAVFAGPGDTIKVGETLLTVEAPVVAAPAPADTPPPPEPAPPEPEAATRIERRPPPPSFEPATPEAEPVTAIGGWSPPAPGIPPRLVVRTGRDDGKELALVDGRDVTIGRDPACEFALTDQRVSSRHVRARLEGDHLLVEDLGSANGTIVDGKRLSAPEYAGEGSEIQVGETVILFTRQPASFYASGPSPTLVGVAAPSLDLHQSLEEAVEQAVEARERRERPRTLLLTAVGGVVAIAAGAGLAAFFLGGGDGKASEAEIIERVSPATVRIDSYNSDGVAISGGSGSIIDLDKGLVLTNNHVGSVGTLKVLNEVTEKSLDAELVAAAPCDDLALVRVRGLKDAVKGLKEVSFGDSTKLKQGDRLIALGYPGSAEGFLNRQLSATTGVVSKVKTTYDQPGSGLPFLRNVIQTDAAINPGNSGGPLFDDEGRQVGVNTARYLGSSGAQSENYAVAIERVSQVVENLKAGKAPKWIGLTFSELINTRTGEFAALGVEAITPGGPAEEVGLAGAGDDGEARYLIVAIDGTPVGTFHAYCDAMPNDGTAVLTVVDRQSNKQVDVAISVGGFSR